MNSLTLLPKHIDRIMDIIQINDIVSQITLEQSENCGIGTVTTMSWETDYNGYHTKMTVVIEDEKEW
jgi:hypothetical protein